MVKEIITVFFLEPVVIPVGAIGKQLLLEELNRGQCNVSYVLANKPGTLRCEIS